MNRKKFIYGTMFGLATVVFAGCTDKTTDVVADSWEDRVIGSYFAVNYPNVLNTDELLIDNVGYQLSVLPSPLIPKQKATTSWIKYDVLGTLLDGNKFKVTTRDEAELLFAPGSVLDGTHFIPDYDSIGASSIILKGIAEVMNYLDTGESITVLMPSVLAYGSTGYSKTGYTATVSANTPVILKITLREVIPDPRAYELKKVEEFVAAHNSLNINELGNFVPLYNTPTGLDTGGGDADKQKGIYIRYVDTVAMTDTTPFPNTDTTMYIKYAGFFLDNFLLDTNIDSIARKELKSAYTVQTSYSTTYTYILGGTGSIGAFNAALRRLNIGSTVEFVFISDWGYGMGNDATIQPYTPLWFRVKREN